MPLIPAMAPKTGTPALRGISAASASRLNRKRWGETWQEHHFLHTTCTPFPPGRPSVNTCEGRCLPLAGKVILHHRPRPGVEDIHVTQRFRHLLVAVTAGTSKHKSQHTLGKFAQTLVIT